MLHVSSSESDDSSYINSPVSITSADINNLKEFMHQIEHDTDVSSENASEYDSEIKYDYLNCFHEIQYTMKKSDANSIISVKGDAPMKPSLEVANASNVLTSNYDMPIDEIKQLDETVILNIANDNHNDHNYQYNKNNDNDVNSGEESQKNINTLSESISIGHLNEQHLNNYHNYNNDNNDNNDNDNNNDNNANDVNIKNDIPKNIDTLSESSSCGNLSEQNLNVQKSIQTYHTEDLDNGRLRKIRKLNNADKVLFIISDTLEEIRKAQKKLNNYKMKNKKLMERQQKLREAIARKEIEYKCIKCKTWCYRCLKEATILCCGQAAYCSVNCQKKHWANGHNLSCANRLMSLKKFKEHLKI